MGRPLGSKNKIQGKRREIKETLQERLWRHCIPVTECGCWIWLSALRTDGYGQLTFNHKHMSAHRASYEAFCNCIPDGFHVLHTCDTPQCINPDHLYIGKDKENARDRKMRGRHRWRAHLGESHGRSLLSSNQVRGIRYDLESGESGKNVSIKYGVSTATISAIKTRRLWRHL
jgi:Autographiviridae endonuclease